LTKQTQYKFFVTLACVLGLLVKNTTKARNAYMPIFNNSEAPDSNRKDTTLKFPITDRVADKYSEPGKAEFDLKDPANIKTSVEYDTASKYYTIEERIGNSFYRNPNYMTLEEFLKYQGTKDEEAYWKKRGSTFGLITKKGNAAPSVDLGGAIFDRLFGGTGVEIKPTGNLEIPIGGNWQYIQNPTIPEAQRRWGVFDFDVQMNLSMLAKIGDKMRMNFNFNSKATFDFENQTKLEYAGKPDQIVKKIELGNVSFPLRSSLIQGVQSLFGAYTQLQFGRLTVSSVISQQKSKKETVTLKGGAQTQQFSVTSDNYDVNRHFLLDQTFRGNYNNALSEFPLIKSQANITKLEVWITNRNGSTENARDVLAFMDLGEASPYKASFTKAGKTVADNANNALYQQLLQTPGIRNIGNAVNGALSLGLTGTIDFEKTYARKLNSSDYSYNPKLGFISLNTSLNPDDVVGVAYQYTYNGRVYQVGEFAQDLPPDTLNPKVLFLKLLKSTTNNPKLPIWELMMKNVYSLNSGNIGKESFKLNVFYQDAGGAEKRYLPEGPNSGTPLISLLNLDRLNNQNDPQPDGIFDFVEGTTIQANQGRIMFPVLEPFGDDLKSAFGGNAQLEKKYLYPQLYDSTQIIAQQFPQFNRFLLKGTYSGTNSSEIYLGGFNIPPGSVTVTQGGTQLIENDDYRIDYSLGRVTILKPGLISSGIPISINYENNANFGFQQQNLMATRLDYYINDKFTIGSTLMRLTERPFNNKVQFGDDPIKNSVVGFDANYQSEVPAITRLVDKLPIYSTVAPSILNASGEVAKIIPRINDRFLGNAGDVYIDDFESSRSTFDLKFPIQSWNLSSTPVGATDAFGRVLFPEAIENNSLNPSKNRAKICWYNIEPSLNSKNQTVGMPQHLVADKEARSGHYVRQVEARDVFPQQGTTTFNNFLTTLDVAYYPTLRGPYNFDTRAVELNGNLKNAKDRWGGISRSIDQSDFEASNVEFIEFWVMDPFIGNTSSTGGSMYFNLGSISEDVLKDSRKSFENGIPYPFDANKVEQTITAQVPRFQQQVNFAFDNQDIARKRQDVGYDGLDNTEEQNKFTQYLDGLKTSFGESSPVYINALNDPSTDDYHPIKGDDYDSLELGILNRYKKFNGPHGNSPLVEGNAQYSNTATNVPESEDINRDNTLNENESYFQYRVDFKPNMEIGENYLVNKRTSTVTLANGTQEPETWYQFKVPIRNYTSKVGGINDFRSIRFMRMFLTGFEDSVVMRFARLEFGRNQWRKYNYSLKNPGEVVPEFDNSATTFNVTSVNIEENSSREPVRYVLPDGIIRQQLQVSNGVNIQQNEQSISMQVCGLEDGDSKGAFKQLNLDMRQFTQLKLFLHAESVIGAAPIANNDIRAFLRLGNDFTTNYYEYQVPLSVTPFGSTTSAAIWPVNNEMVITLQDLINAKAARTAAGAPTNVLYTTQDAKGNFIKIIGNPNLGDVKTAMLGIHNPKQQNGQGGSDDGSSKCAEVWYNELRVTKPNEQGGYAAIGRADLQLADLGTLRVSGDMHTIGYGNIDQKLNQRLQDNYYQYSATSNINGGKLLPKKWGVQLPVFVGISKNASSPKYDPYDLDTELKDKLELLAPAQRDSLKKVAQDATVIKSFNVQNVRVTPEGKFAKKAPWNPANIDMSYSYINTEKTNPLLVFDNATEQHASAGYSYAPTIKSIEPFKKLIKSKKKYWSLIKDINIKPLPSNITFRTDLDRYYGATQARNIDDGSFVLPTTYNKFFTWGRNYNLRWDLTRSLSFDYSANNQSRVDEPFGAIDTREKKDTVLDNIKKLGRNTMFSQSLNANYKLPINKIPLLDWININTSYQATYNWVASSRLAYNLGNTIGNTQLKSINGDFNLSQLYNKNKWLRTINQPKQMMPNKSTKPGATDAKPGSKPGESRGGESRSGSAKGGRGDADAKGNEAQETASGKDKIKPVAVPKLTKEQEENKLIRAAYPGYTKQIVDSLKKTGAYSALLKDALKKKAAEEKRLKLLAKAAKKRKPPTVPDGVRFVGKLLTMVKSAGFAYSENSNTSLPGFMDSTTNFGNNFKGSNNNLPFAFGYQPNRDYFDRLGNNGLISRDSLFNANLNQGFVQTFTARATAEPFQDFRIELNASKNFNKTYNEIFKDTTGSAGLAHLNPFETGGFNISYISFQSLFQKSDTNGINTAFNNFEDNRKIISNRLGLINPYNQGVLAPEDPGYAKGYTRYAQEVIIPSFLAAYTNKNPANFPLQVNKPGEVRNNPFKFLIPLPNWRVSYNGLAKLPMFKNKFTNINIAHGYTNTLSMNSFNSSLLYNDGFNFGFPSFIDSNSGNYVPYFFVPNITITENFGPLLSVDAATKSGMTIHAEYKKSRTLSLSLLDFQLNETGFKEIIFGGGMRLKKVRLPISAFGLNKMKNDMNIKVDFGLRDDYSKILFIDQNRTQIIRGSKAITFSPNIDYIYSQNLTVRLFFDRRINLPKTTQSYPLYATKGGIMLRFLLGQ
jgi:cell surface protein SprA